MGTDCLDSEFRTKRERDLFSYPRKTGFHISISFVLCSYIFIFVSNFLKYFPGCCFFHIILLSLEFSFRIVFLQLHLFCTFHFLLSICFWCFSFCSFFFKIKKSRCKKKKRERKKTSLGE